MNAEEYKEELDGMLAETALPVEFQVAVEETVMEFSTQQSDYSEMLEQAEAMAPIWEKAVKAYKERTEKLMMDMVAALQKDDDEAYFQAFERFLEAHKIDCDAFPIEGLKTV